MGGLSFRAQGTEAGTVKCRQCCAGTAIVFFGNEGYEPPHIHVDKAGNTVRLWLETVSVARNVGFSEREIIEAKVREERARFLEAWNGYFGKAP